MYYPNYPMKIIKNNLKAKGLTNSTIKTYSSILEKFFDHTGKVNNFTEEEINNYLNFLIINP